MTATRAYFDEEAQALTVLLLGLERTNLQQSQTFQVVKEMWESKTGREWRRAAEPVERARA